MVEKYLMLEPEVVKIFEHIDNGHNFLLSGGAGSGKTYSLIHVIQEIIKRHPTTQVACITYTNAAVREISEKIDHQSLIVSTIHEFLWRVIKKYQAELKTALISLHNDEDINKIRSNGKELTLEELKDVKILYKEYTAIRKGIISHDELLILALFMYQSHPKLSDITKSMYPFILVDEYQDTSPTVIDILLNQLEKSKKANIVGFFGDAMQSIYPDSIGNLDEYIKNNKVWEVQKAQNRRCPQSVITLANKLRTDGIEQDPSDDPKAPNMCNGVIKEGTATFVYSTSDKTSLDQLKNDMGWDFTDVKNVKELNLTHNLIAPRAGFKCLMDIYDKDKVLEYKKRISAYIKSKNITEDFSDKTFGDVIAFLNASADNKAQVSPTNGQQDFIDQNPDLFTYAKKEPWEQLRRLYVEKEQLIDDKKDNEDEIGSTSSSRDDLIKHIFSIQNLVHLYQEKSFNEFLRKTEYKIKTVEQKKVLANAVSFLSEVNNHTIEEVLKFANDVGIRKWDDKLDQFVNEKTYLYDRVKTVKYSEFQNLFGYLEGRTPFSTQHKVKGNQFDQVLVVLDNGNWNNYNFDNLFNENGNPNVLERTKKIFYVCCTRAKEDLVVYYHKPSQVVIDQAAKWFGKANIKNIG